MKVILEKVCVEMTGEQARALVVALGSRSKSQMEAAKFSQEQIDLLFGLYRAIDNELNKTE